MAILQLVIDGLHSSHQLEARAKRMPAPCGGSGGYRKQARPPCARCVSVQSMATNLVSQSLYERHRAVGGG